MADYAPNYTSRYKVAYQAHGKRHEIMFRYGREAGPPPPDFLAGVQDVFDALQDSMVADFALLGENYSSFDTDFYLPINTGLILIGSPVLAVNPAMAPHNINFQGLTIQGNRTMFYLYGFFTEPVDNDPAGVTNYRLTRGENARIANALDVLNGGIASLTGADNSEVAAFKQYVNVNINSYYQRKART